MELACLARKQQASSSNWPHRALFRHHSKGVVKSKKNMLPGYPGWFSATFSGTTYFSVRPPAVGNGDLVVFWPVLGLGHSEKFRARAKNRKTQFPAARGTFGGKSGRPKSFSLKLHNFLHFTFCLTGQPWAGRRKMMVLEAILA